MFTFYNQDTFPLVKLHIYFNSGWDLIILTLKGLQYEKTGFYLSGETAMVNH